MGVEFKKSFFKNEHIVFNLPNRRFFMLESLFLILNSFLCLKCVTEFIFVHSREIKTTRLV